MELTIRQLIEELRAASEVVGADAEVEGVESVITTTRSVRLDDGGKELDLREQLSSAKATADEHKGEVGSLIDKINEALALLRSDKPDVKAAIEVLV